jgi:YidC/Oxa1 family membrane protein insertase
MGAFDGVVALDGRRLEITGYDKLREKAVVFSEPKWGGFGDQYFVRVGVTGSADGARVVAERRGDASAVVGIEIPMTGTPAEARLMLYFGPKDVDVLEAAAPSLRRAVDFGWFWFIALPLLRVLKASHTLTGNYGVDIILLTVLIKVLFWPLAQKSIVSMREMQKLQPQMAKLRERYKDDAQQLQKEMMELYRRHRVNPFSGCLPMLVQLPVFIGLYNTLINAIELRHAAFFWWVNDLSAPERLSVGGIGIPVLALAMGVSMLVQQWMTPASGDPTQRRIMMLMPVMFTFMFINFPSGLVLYWLVNNVLTIVQQYFLVMRSTGK